MPGEEMLNQGMLVGGGSLLTGLSILLWKYLFGAGRARDGAESKLFDNLAQRLNQVELQCSRLQDLHREETSLRLAAERRVVEVETESMRKVARLEIRIEQLATILRGLGAVLPPDPFGQKDDSRGGAT